MPHRWLVAHPRARALFPPFVASHPLLWDECFRESLASAVPSLLLTSCFSDEPREVNFGVLCHSGDRSGPSERATSSLRGCSLIRTSSQPRAWTPLLGSASPLTTVGRPGAASPRSAWASAAAATQALTPRERSRLRAARATCPPRSAARAVVAVAASRPPPLYSQPLSHPLPHPARRSPQPLSISWERASFFDAARNPPGGVCGLPSKQLCGEKKKRTKVELNFSNSTSSQAQTVSTSGNARLLGKLYNLECHRVKSCTVLQCLFQKQCGSRFKM